MGILKTGDRVLKRCSCCQKQLKEADLDVIGVMGNGDKSILLANCKHCHSTVSLGMVDLYPPEVIAEARKVAEKRRKKQSKN